MSIKDLITQLDHNTNLMIRLDSYIESKEQRRPPDGFYHPSMAGNCSRAIWYYQTGVEAPPFSPVVMRKMDVGTALHVVMQDYFDGMGELLAKEHVVKYTVKYPAPSITVSGSCDGILEKDGILEFKTAMSWSYQSMVKAGVPTSEHFAQWNLYSYGERIWEGIILIMNKDNQELWPFVVKFDKSIFNKTIEKFKLVHKHVKSGKPPDKPYKGMSDKACLYCDYKFVCWERKKK